MKNFVRFFEVLFLVLFPMGIFAQNVPEYMSVKFNGLPFQELWDQGTFAYNDWVLVPENTNWSVNTGVGNPLPSADFSWEPVRNNYSLSLETPELYSGYFAYTTIWCDFDYKLVNLNNTGNEKLFIDVFHNGTWKNKAWFSNTASKDWTPIHVALFEANDTTFKVRFRAEGTNSVDILHWYVDNITIYLKCNPPVDLALQDIADRQVTLTWNAPEGGTGCPDPQWIHWDDGTNSNGIGTCAICIFDIAARWDAAQIVALDGGAVTKISFYPYGVGTANFRIRVWQGPDAATLIVDQAVPSVTYDEWNIIDIASPVSIDITQELWIGCNVEMLSGWPAGCDAGPAVDGYGNMIYSSGEWATLISLNPVLDYNWNIQGYVEALDDHATTTKKVIPLVQNMNYKSGGTFSASGLPSLNPVKFNPVESGTKDICALLGYNLYRSEDNKITWAKLNADPITDTNFVDVVPVYQEYCYYATSVFITYGSMTCESDSSNIVCAEVVTGIDPLNGGRISIFPNPATDNIFVKSDFTITNIEVLNYIGQPVYIRQNVSEKNLKVNIADLTTGVYFVKLTTVEGIKTMKITVTK